MDPGRHVRFAVRTLAARRGLVAIRIVTLALVVGAGSAVFLVADAMLLRPLPFKHAERLVRVFTQPPGMPDFAHANPLHPLEFIRFRERPGLLERLEGIWAAERAIGGDGEPESVPAASVSAGLFDLLGASPILGRTFTEEEARQGAHVVVLSHGIWMRRSGGDPGIIGRILMIDRQPHEIVGVMAPGFQPVFVQSEFWTPLEVREGHLVLPAATFIQSVGRIREGSTIDQARAELRTMLAAVALESPATLKGWTVEAMGLRQAQYGPQTAAVSLLLVAVLALSLIATANLANLTLAEVLARRSDIAVRVALGASRADLLWPEAVKTALDRRRGRRVWPPADGDSPAHADRARSVRRAHRHSARAAVARRGRGGGPGAVDCRILRDRADAPHRGSRYGGGPCRRRPPRGGRTAARAPPVVAARHADRDRDCPADHRRARGRRVRENVADRSGLRSYRCADRAASTPCGRLRIGGEPGELRRRRADPRAGRSPGLSTPRPR